MAAVCGGSTTCQTLSATGMTLPVPVTSGVTVTQSTSNAIGVQATGNGTQAGVQGTGGTTSGPGGSFTGGAPDGIGGAFLGTGAGVGLSVTGGTSGRGGVFTGGGTEAGLVATGGTTGSGVDAFAGGTPTADTNDRWAFYAGAGHMLMAGGNPTSTTSFSNTVTPMNLVKGWALVTASVLGAGFNVTSVAANGSCVTVNWAADFASTSYGCVVSANDSNSYIYTCTHGGSGGVASVCATLHDGTSVNVAASAAFTVMAFGAQP
jgi:hypothetical protein